jgi:threonine dehydrogenase-like Zn-dependent dehydrogenase
MQAIHAPRLGGSVGYVGVPHGVAVDGEQQFYAHVHLHGGPAPVRRYLPRLINLVLTGTINPGEVFDLTLPLEKDAEGLSRDGPTTRHQDSTAAITAICGESQLTAKQ